MQTSNCTSDPLELEDMPANFGPRIPTEGIEGFLIVSLHAVFIFCEPTFAFTLVEC